MFRKIKTTNFFSRCYTKSEDQIDELEYDEYCNCNECRYRNDTNKLNECASPLTGSEQTTIASKETNTECTECTVYTVYGNSTCRVINLCNLIKELNAEHDKDTGTDTDDCSCPRVDCRTTCGDCDKTSKRAVHSHRHIWLLVADPSNNHGSNRSTSCCKVGCHKNIAYVHCLCNAAQTVA